MSTTTEKEIDYQVYLIENPPDLSNIIRGPEAREKRREAALKRMLQDKGSRDKGSDRTRGQTSLK